jgi:hypothetical protein
VRSCLAARLVVEAVPGLKPGPRAAPVSKMRQAAAPKDAMYASIMRRDVDESLNRDHRAPSRVSARPLRKTPIRINLSTSQLNENVSWIDLCTMEPSGTAPAPPA